MTDLALTAKDGYRLGATIYGDPGAKAVLVLPATGVPQAYYAKFAAYLAAQGFRVLTFDYRGIGRSRSGNIRELRARMRDWALLDASAALDFLSSSAKILVVGHSFGGQALGLLPEAQRIAAALIVGSQSGYWRHWPALGRAWMWPATHFVLPLFSRLLGYFPWASWCRNPTYLVGALGVEAAYARFAAPLRAYSLDDDRFAPLAAVRALLELYPASRSELRRVAPRELGVRRIGHFGFFREPFRDTLWREAGDWLNRH